VQVTDIDRIANNKQLIREWLDALAMGPAEAWRDRVDPDVVIRLPFAPPGVTNELRGLPAALATMSEVWKAKQLFTWHDVVVRTTEEPQLMLTTARSEVQLVSGRLYTNSYVILTVLRGRKVIEHVEYFNPLPVMAAFGPAPG
jgi:ketosteroid isomerase-like protein